MKDDKKGICLLSEQKSKFSQKVFAISALLSLRTFQNQVAIYC